MQFCTRLAGKASWFLPFNRRWNDGAGNPPNPDGLPIDYLWREVLTRRSPTNILENYARGGGVEGREERQDATDADLAALPPRARRGAPPAGRRRRPRRGAGGTLIQHSAGSGKGNSIAWLAHQLIGLTGDDAPVCRLVVIIADEAHSSQGGRTSAAMTQALVGGGRGRRGGDL